jgi:hypothetical protein
LKFSSIEEAHDVRLKIKLIGAKTFPSCILLQKRRFEMSVLYNLACAANTMGANGIAGLIAMALPLQYELPKNELFKQDSAKLTALGAVGVSFWVGFKLAQKTHTYFKERIEKTSREYAASVTFNAEEKNFRSLLISLGVGAAFYLLNTPHINQIFERSAPSYSNVIIRGMGFGYMSVHVLNVLNDWLYGN